VAKTCRHGGITATPNRTKRWWFYGKRSWSPSQLLTIIRSPVAAGWSSAAKSRLFSAILRGCWTAARRVIERRIPKKLASGEIICREENDPGDSFYIILSGAVEVFVESIAQQSCDSLFWVLVRMSLLMGSHAHNAAYVKKQLILFVVDRDNLQSLLKKHQS